MSFVEKGLTGLGNIFGGLIGDLSGAKYAANNTGNYYNDAMNRLISSYGSGSPAAKTFAGEYQASMQPQFDQQDKALAAKEAAMGITNSGASKADFSDLKSNQARALAAPVGSLYQGALADYAGLNGAEPAAQAGAYQDALNNFYSALKTAATGMPSSSSNATFPGGGNAGNNPYSNDGIYQTPYGYYTLAPNSPNSPDANPYSGADAGTYVA